jgi:NAD(P)-dependent dehydrogenase (short-subunit alcohol dehydrogenase family)
MIPEFDQFPIFYFTNHHSIYGPYDEIPCMPDHFQKLDFELESAIVIGKKGRNIPAEEADDYIAGFMIMNDMSARTLQMEEMKLNLGPAKGKDFCTIIGPWLVTPDELDDVLNSNIRATLLCMQQAVPLLQAAGSGRIVNFGCATADQTIARKYTVPYYIAKSGVITLTKSYAELLAQYHITVNTVSPGVVENSIVTQALPMGRPAQYADITAAVRWLISAEASYVSGANLEVAGGWVPHHSL